MKVLIVNGSPRKSGCTSRAILELTNQFNYNNVDIEVYNISSTTSHCDNCRWCKIHNTNCFKDNYELDKFEHLIKDSDAVIFCSPTYYGSITSQLCAFLTRMFYSNPKILEFKPVAYVITSRRAGSTSAYSQLNLFFTMHSCFIVGSQYWNELHGDTPEEVEYDIEGLQTMRTLANNVTSIITSFNKLFIKPNNESKKHTNFISREYLELLK